jgi:hypothetical protein
MMLSRKGQSPGPTVDPRARYHATSPAQEQGRESQTWLIEDGVPEAAQAKRLGHRLPTVRGIYSTPSLIPASSGTPRHPRPDGVGRALDLPYRLIEGEPHPERPIAQR